MNYKAFLQNPKNQQAILEVVFPFAGYYFWNWSLLIIVAFYYIDYISSQTMFFRRLFKIEKHQYESNVWVLPLSIFSFLLLFIAGLWFLPDLFAQRYSANSGNYIDELIKFFKNEWYFFPVIMLMYYMMDKMFFYMPKRFMNYKTKFYFIKNIKYNAIANAFIVVGALTVMRYEFTDVVVIFLIVIIKLCSDVFIKKMWLKIDS